MADRDEIDRGWDDLLGPADDDPVPAVVPPVESVPIAAAPPVIVEETPPEPAAPVAEEAQPEPDARVEDDDDDGDPIAEPRTRRVPAWTFVAAGVPILGLVWYLAADHDPEPPEPAPVTAASSTKAREAAPVGGTAHEAAATAKAPTTKHAKVSEPDDAAEPTVDQHGEAYDAAKLEYDASKSADALEAMAVAACRMDDGAKARSAYRKMLEREGRRKVFWECRATEINLRWAEPGYTPVELVRRAARTLASGDAKQALELARTSNNTTRSDAAILIMGKSYCALEQPRAAGRLLTHLPKSQRLLLEEACRAAGHTIEP